MLAAAAVLLLRRRAKFDAASGLGRACLPGRGGGWGRVHAAASHPLQRRTSELDVGSRSTATCALPSAPPLSWVREVKEMKLAFWLRSAAAERSPAAVCCPCSLHAGVLAV